MHEVKQRPSAEGLWDLSRQGDRTAETGSQGVKSGFRSGGPNLTFLFGGEQRT